MAEFKKCHNCQRKVMMARNRTTENLAPLDPEPNPVKGNCLIARDTQHQLVYEVLTGDELKEARKQNIALYLSHFASCSSVLARRTSKPLTHPEIELARTSDDPNGMKAHALARALGNRFQRPFYQLKTDDPLIWRVMLDEEIHPNVLAQIKQFIGEYAAAKEAAFEISTAGMGAR